MSCYKLTIMLYLSILIQGFIAARSSSSRRNVKIEVRSSPIPLKSATMANPFQDLTANLSMDGNDVTCASSSWVTNRSIDLSLEKQAGIHEISLLMHKYVDVHLEAAVKNSNGIYAHCNTVQLNTEAEREVTVACKQEIFGESISLKDLRNGNEFFVICEVNAYGAPVRPAASAGDDQLLKYIGIGCGVALLVILVVVLIVFLCRRNREPRRPSQTHSLNTLSMMTSQQAVGGNSFQQRRLPIPAPRPNVVSRSIPNPYDRPLSLKDTAVIYETIPGDEPPYLTIVEEKDMYDDASSCKR